jgi:hypothetical protein
MINQPQFGRGANLEPDTSASMTESMTPVIAPEPMSDTELTVTFIALTDTLPMFP